MSTQPLVLVADDEPRITKLVSIALSEEGFRVVTANGGEDALAKAGEVRPVIVLLEFGLSSPGAGSLRPPPPCEEGQLGACRRQRSSGSLRQDKCIRRGKDGLRSRESRVGSRESGVGSRESGVGSR